MFSLQVVRVPSVFRVSRHIRKFSVPATVPSVSENEVKYPPILDLSFKARQFRKKEEHSEFVKRQETVEEKLIAINIPRYYGWTSFLMNEYDIPYNSLESAQYLTRTHILPHTCLPVFYDNVISSEALDQIVKNVRSQIEEVLVLEYSRRKRKQELDPKKLSDPEVFQNIQTESVTRQIHRILLIELSSKYPHLLETQTDYDPRVEAFWTVGGIVPPTSLVTKKKRNKNKDLAACCEDPIDRHFQYIGKPNFQLRHALPLRELVPFETAENPDYEVPDYRYDPRATGYHLTRRHGTNIPGFWPGDRHEFGLLSFHNCGYMAKRNREWDDEENALKTQALKACFAWVQGQATYQGFSTYNDVTYPFVTQNIITNGQWWLFSAYQLNTMVLYDKFIDENPKKNFLWTTNPLQLFDKIEDKKVHGFNDEVLQHLIKMYVNEPQKRDVEMKPFLGKDVQIVSEIEDDEKRVWLEREFKHLMACRPRSRPTPEIHNWQQIYMRMFQTRPMEKRHESWQNGRNIMMRRLDDRWPRYIPKCLRPHPKSRTKYAKDYWPK